MSLLESFLSQRAENFTEQEVISSIESLSQNQNVVDNLAILKDVTKKYAPTIRQKGIPILFSTLHSYKNNSSIIKSIFEILCSLLDCNEIAEEAAKEILNLQESVKLIVEQIQVSQKDVIILGLQLLSKIAILQHSQLPCAIIATDNSLEILMQIVDSNDYDVLVEFLSFISVCAQGDKDFQQIVVFNLLDSLIRIIRDGHDVAFNALTSILIDNKAGQDMFYSSYYHEDIFKYIVNGNTNAKSFLKAMFNDRIFQRNQEYLVGSQLFKGIIIRCETDTLMYSTLELAIKNNTKLQDSAIESGIIQNIITQYFENENLDAMDFVNHGIEIYPSMIAKALCKNVETDRKHLDLALKCIESNEECKRIFANQENSESSFFEKMFSNLESSETFESCLEFCIVECWKCNLACYEFIEDEKRIEYISGSSTSDICTALCSVLQAELILFGEMDKSDIIDEQIRNAKEIIKNLPKTYTNAVALQCIRRFLNEPEKSFSESDILDQIMDSNSNFSLTPKPKSNTDLKSEYDSDSGIEDQNYVKKHQNVTNNEIESRISEITKNFEQEKQEISKRFQEQIQIQDKLSNRLIEEQQDKIKNLETKLDTITVHSQKTIADLNKSKAALESEYKSKIAILENKIAERADIRATVLKQEITNLRRDIDMMRSSQSALLDEQLGELEDLKKKYESIIQLNQQLKFKVSQLEHDSNVKNNELSVYKNKFEKICRSNEENEQTIKQLNHQLLAIRNSFNNSSSAENFTRVIESQRSTIQSLNDQLESEKGSSYNLRNLCDNQRQIIADQGREVEELNVSIRKLKSDIDSQKQVNRQFDSEINSLRIKKRTYKQANARLKQANTSLKNELIMSRSNLSGTDQNITIGFDVSESDESLSFSEPQNDLKVKNEELMQLVEVSTEQFQKERNETKRLKQLLAESEQKQKEIEQENDSLKSQIIQLSNSPINFEDENNKKIKSLMADKARLESTIQTMKREEQKIKDDLNGIQTKSRTGIENYIEEINKLRTRLNNAQEELNKYKSESIRDQSVLIKKVSKLQDERKILQKKLNDSEMIVQAMNLQRSALGEEEAEELKRLREENKAGADELRQLREETAMASADILKAKEQTKALQESLFRAESERDGLRIYASSLENDIQRLEGRLSFQASEAEKSRGQAEALLYEMGQRSILASGDTIDVEAVRAEVDSLQKDLARLKRLMSAKSEKLHTLKKQNGELRAMLSESLDRDTYDRLSRRMAQLQSELDVRRANERRLSRRIDELQAELKSTQKNIMEGDDDSAQPTKDVSVVSKATDEIPSDSKNVHDVKRKVYQILGEWSIKNSSPPQKSKPK